MRPLVIALGVAVVPLVIALGVRVVPLIIALGVAPVPLVISLGPAVVPWLPLILATRSVFVRPWSLDTNTPMEVTTNSLL